MRRLPIYLLIDTSGSTIGEPIESVKVGLKAMLSRLRQDPFALETANISIITYDSEAKVLLPLTPLVDVPLPEITCSKSGTTNIGAALKMLCKQIDSEVHLSTLTQKGDFRRGYLIITVAGEPSSWDSEIEKIFIEVRKRLDAIVCYIEPLAKELPINDQLLDSCRVDGSNIEIKRLFQVLPGFINQFEHGYAVGNDAPLKLNDLLTETSER